jgi:ATP-dependent DNA ligase
MYQHACGIGLEGVVSRVLDSRYQFGRSNDWAKKACAQREMLPIAGFALKESKFDGIYLGRPRQALIYAGKVDHGFDAASAKDLQARLKPLIRKTQPYAKKIAHRGIWVEPSLLAEIEYRGKSAEGKVRHSLMKLTHRFKELAPERRPQDRIWTGPAWVRNPRPRGRVPRHYAASHQADRCRRPVLHLCADHARRQGR